MILKNDMRPEAIEEVQKISPIPYTGPYTDPYTDPYLRLRYILEVHFDMRFKRYGKYGGFNHVIDGRTPGSYPLTYGVNRLGVNRLIQDFIRPVPAIQKVVDGITQEMKAGDVTVGVHYRGTDTAFHWPFKKVSTY